ncbi:MAG: DUF5011 domain-containing protein [Bacilli bacterium]
MINNKRKVYYIFISIILIIILLLTINKVYQSKFCYIKFITNSKQVIKSIKVKKNTIIKQPIVNDKKDYVFNGWFINKIKVDFTKPFNKDAILKVKWLPIDTKKPTIVLKGDSNYSIILSDTYKEPGYKAFDNYDGDISSKVEVSGKVDTNEIGVYTLNYKVKDKAGNESIIKRIINVDISNTIKKDNNIIVSISMQKLWYYKDNEIYFTSDVVTGMKNRNDTAPGTYYIRSKQRNASLKGYKYPVYVDYWMPITNNNGVALHDSAWRPSFGKEVYINNGSHGCINLPLSSAEFLFNNVSVGTPVNIL